MEAGTAAASAMTAADVTGITDQFVSAIGLLKAPVVSILGAGIVIVMLFIVFNLAKKGTKKATS